MTSLYELIGNPHLLEMCSVQAFSSAECVSILTELKEDWRSARIAADSKGNPDAIDLQTRSVLAQQLPDPDGMVSERVLDAVVEANERVYRFDLRGILPEDGLSVLRYEAGTNDHYRPHRDYGPSHALRKLTVIVQLSPPDDYLGGDLILTETNQIGTREQGAVTLFPSFLSHTVTPVVQGTRHCIVGWVHGSTFR